MDIQPQEIIQYIKSNGKITFNEWLESFKDWKTRTKIETRLKRLKLGNFGDCKSVGDEVYELRINYGVGYRIYFAQINKWEDSLIESLTNIDHSAMYLESALEEKEPEKEFLLEIIKDLMKAHQELNYCSDDLEYSYQEIVNILQKTGGKEIYTLIDFINKLALTIFVFDFENYEQ